MVKMALHLQFLRLEQTKCHCYVFCEMKDRHGTASRFLTWHCVPASLVIALSTLHRMRWLLWIPTRNASTTSGHSSGHNTSIFQTADLCRTPFLQLSETEKCWMRKHRLFQYSVAHEHIFWNGCKKLFMPMPARHLAWPGMPHSVTGSCSRTPTGLPGRMNFMSLGSLALCAGGLTKTAGAQNTEKHGLHAGFEGFTRQLVSAEKYSICTLA